MLKTNFESADGLGIGDFAEYLSEISYLLPVSMSLPINPVKVSEN